MRAHAHSKGYPFARSVTPSPRMTCNISTCAKRTACSRTAWRWNYCCHSMTHDNWHILSASANNGCMRVCVRPRMKKGTYIVIMKIIRINGAPTVVAWRVAWVCACTVVPLSGTVRTDTRGARSRMTCACVRTCLCGIVGTYLCCHGLRCGSSSRRPAHGRLDSRTFSVSPCRRLQNIVLCALVPIATCEQVCHGQHAKQWRSSFSYHITLRAYNLI
jgi:hypothetical protein